MKIIRVGIIGVGSRGNAHLYELSQIEGVELTAVCDVYEDRIEETVKNAEKYFHKTPKGYTDYKELIDKEKPDFVTIATSWESHIDISIYAMERGVAVGLEVGGAYSIDSLWQLVHTYEKTKTPFAFLENCCYTRLEMMALNMTKKGILGEIVHCTGAYNHDRRIQVAEGLKKRHYRMRNYMAKNCDNYPTHDLGPISKILGINHTNKMLTLTSVASKAVGMTDYIKEKFPDDEFLRNAKWNQGDVTTTVIKCAGGETIVLNLKTTLPTFYSRNFSIQGTDGIIDEATQCVFLDREEFAEVEADFLKKGMLNIERCRDELDLDHPLWKDHIKNGSGGGHGGGDLLMFKDVIERLRDGRPMWIDVYDCAAWMAITALSESSIAMAGAPVPIPDFTNGKWVFELEKRKMSECDDIFDR